MKVDHLNKNCKEIVENICPYCGEILIMNKRSFANHVRWCKKNPRYDEIRNNTITKLHNTRHDKFEYKCTCKVCGKEYTVICTKNDFLKSKYRKTCSSKCAHKQSTENGRNKLIETWNNKLGVEKQIICEYCGKTVNLPRKSYSKYCCEQCKRNARFERQNKNKTEKVLYRKMCNFKFGLNDFPEEYNFDLIKENGWYKAKNRGNNLYGVSRDHIVSVKFGFEHSIDPYIISHPANCQLLIHTDNESKGSKCDMSISELIEKINKWNKIYGEYPNKICYLLKDFKVTL